MCGTRNNPAGGQCSQPAILPRLWVLSSPGGYVEAIVATNGRRGSCRIVMAHTTDLARALRICTQTAAQKFADLAELSGCERLTPLQLPDPE